MLASDRRTVKELVPHRSGPVQPILPCQPVGLAFCTTVVAQPNAEALGGRSWGSTAGEIWSGGLCKIEHKGNFVSKVPLKFFFVKITFYKDKLEKSQPVMTGNLFLWGKLHAIFLLISRTWLVNLAQKSCAHSGTWIRGCCGVDAMLQRISQKCYEHGRMNNHKDKWI